MTAVTHPFVAYGAKVGNIVGPDNVTYDGVVQGKGPCTHHKKITHKTTGLGFTTGGTETGFLNLQFFFKLINGKMRMMYQQHVAYTAIETKPVEGSILL